MKRALIILAALVLPSVAQAQSFPGVQFTCSADDIGATLTRLTGCQAPEPPMRRYITSVVAQSTTTTSGQFILRYGNSTRGGGTANCATGTTSLLPSAATVARIASPANTAAPTALVFDTPLILPADKDLCVLGVGTNTTTIEITGYVAP